MTAPEFDRQLLLSAALDGALNEAEQTIFDRELNADPTFAQDWQELQDLQSDLRLSLKPVRQQRAASDLAARIVASAFEAGRNQPSDVITSASIPKISARDTTHSNTPHDSTPVRPAAPESGRRVWSARIAGALALAASLMLMVTWLTNFDSETAPPQRLADANVSAGPSAADSDNAGIAAASSSNASDKLVMQDRGLKPNDALPSFEEVAKTPRPTFAEIAQTVTAETSPGMPADRAPTTVANGNDTPSSPRAKLQLLLVFSVQVSDKGREQLALQNALRSSGIRLGSETVVSDNVVSQLRQSNVVTTSEAPSQSAKLFFIEGSAKKIDQLINTMLDQPEMFESVSMSLATDPPLLASVSDLPVQDPTKIKSNAAEGMAISMTSSDDRPLAVSDSFPFMAVDRSLMQMGVGRVNSQSTQDKDDFVSQLLLIVR